MAGLVKLPGGGIGAVVGVALIAIIAVAVAKHIPVVKNYV